jgi:hypothetical protein
MAKGNRKRSQPKQQALPAKSEPPQSEQPARSRSKALGEWANWKDVRTSLVTLVIGAVIGWLGKSALDSYQNYREHTEQRTKISQEIPHRISFARQHVVNDVNLAKKYLDGVDPRFCRHEELAGVALRKLLDDWQSAGGQAVSGDTISLAANPSPTTEQVQRLFELLEETFPAQDVNAR